MSLKDVQRLASSLVCFGCSEYSFGGKGDASPATYFSSDSKLCTLRSWTSSSSSLADSLGLAATAVDAVEEVSVGVAAVVAAVIGRARSDAGRRQGWTCGQNRRLDLSFKLN